MNFSLSQWGHTCVSVFRKGMRGEERQKKDKQERAEIEGGLIIKPLPRGKRSKEFTGISIWGSNEVGEKEGGRVERRESREKKRNSVPGSG